MSGCKKTTIVSPHSSYTALYRNPLTDHNADHPIRCRFNGGDDDEKENLAAPNRNAKHDGKENAAPLDKNPILNEKCKLLKASSLQLIIKKHEPDSGVGFRNWECVDSVKPSSLNVWDYSDSEAAPASSWATLPNRSLLCRPLPVDVGRCTCIIVKEKSPDGFNGGTLYTLYTHEGKGRQNRKLGVAHHRRSGGKSEFIVALNARGIVTRSDDSLIGTVTCNIMGSKYLIWDQGHSSNKVEKQAKLLAAVKFTATLSTWTGNYRSIKAWIPKHQSMQLKNTNQVLNFQIVANKKTLEKFTGKTGRYLRPVLPVNSSEVLFLRQLNFGTCPVKIQHINGLPTGWEGNQERVHQLFSKVPSYNKFSNRYELDFRDKGRAGLKIRSSIKNFQLTQERNGKQIILQLGRVGKSKYVMDYRYPLTGYQAFCMCLASIDSKLCCTV